MFDLALASADLENPLVERLRETVSWARTQDFYRRKWRGATVVPAAIDLETFACLPLTTRAELRRFQASEHESRNGRLRAAHAIAEEALPIRITRSSGSSGAPIWRRDTRASWSRLRRASAHAFEISSVGPRDRVALLVRFGASLGPWALLEGLEEIGSLTMVPPLEPQRELIAWLESFSPTILVGKFSLLAALASRRGRPSDRPSIAERLRALIAVGEPGGGTPDTRRALRSAFGTDVFDRYGFTEGGTIAAECTAHPGGMHVLEEQVHVEVVDPKSGAPLPDGARGEIVVTTLGRASLPLIRYRTGDMASVVRRHACPCGRTSALLMGGVTRAEAHFPMTNANASATPSANAREPVGRIGFVSSTTKRDDAEFQ